MLVEIKGYCKLLDVEESVICDYNDVIFKEKQSRKVKGLVTRELLVKPEGVKRGKSFATSFFNKITMQEATTGKKMLQWGE